MKIALACCQNFEPEVRLALASAGLSDIVRVTFPADCARPALSPQALEDSVPGPPGAARVAVLGGACCARLARAKGRFAVHRLRQCFDLVAPPALVDHYLSKGAYLVTPGWLAHWRERFARQGIDRATARALFREAMPRIVLFDTGVDPAYGPSLSELSDFADVPAEVVPVGIDYARSQLAEWVAELRLEEERAESLRTLAAAHRRSTEFAATFDLIGRLTDITSERAVVRQVLDACAMLFGARRVAFISMLGGVPAEVAAEPQDSIDPHGILARLAEAGGGRSVVRGGFTLPVQYAETLLGVLDVQETAAPDHLEHDFELAMSIAGVAGLAISNARRYQELHRTQDALAQANAQLEEADRRKNQFLAVLSHELRNPLATIRSGLYILERAAPGSERAVRAQEVIDRQFTQLTRLVNDLLDITRISRGKVQLQRERLDLAALARRAVDDQRFSFERSGLDLRIDVAGEPLPIDGDGVRVAQVIGNLLQNAAKFTDPGGSVAVRAEASPDRAEAVLQVRDTGRGISPQVLPRLFQPFMQADATLDRSKGGLGLGLALIKGLVEIHGGSVSAESEGLGRGATFTVRLPLRKGEVGGAATVASFIDPEDPARPDDRRRWRRDGSRSRARPCLALLLVPSARNLAQDGKDFRLQTPGSRNSST